MAPSQLRSATCEQRPPVPRGFQAESSRLISAMEARCASWLRLPCDKQVTPYLREGSARIIRGAWTTRRVWFVACVLAGALPGPLVETQP